METRVKDREVRYYDVELRAQDNEGKRYIEGYAARFGVDSSVLYEWHDGEWVEFVERIRPGAFADALADPELDVIMNLQHNDDRMLARLHPADDIRTLELREDEQGLFVRFEVPDTTDGNDAYEHVQRGNLKRMSFAFTVNKAGEEWSEREDGTLVREIVKFSRLFDTAIVRRPAYNATEVNVVQRSGMLRVAPARRSGQYERLRLLKLKGKSYGR